MKDKENEKSFGFSRSVEGTVLLKKIIAPMHLADLEIVLDAFLPPRMG